MSKGKCARRKPKNQAAEERTADGNACEPKWRMKAADREKLHRAEASKRCFQTSGDIWVRCPGSGGGTPRSELLQTWLACPLRNTAIREITAPRGVLACGSRFCSRCAESGSVRRPAKSCPFSTTSDCDFRSLRWSECLHRRSGCCSPYCRSGGRRARRNQGQVRELLHIEGAAESGAPLAELWLLRLIIEMLHVALGVARDAAEGVG